MAIISPDTRKHTIDLRGPDGNAFVLVGTGRQWLREMGASKEDIDAYTKDSMSSDYEHVIKLFNEKFGHFVDLIVPERYKNACTAD